MKKIREIADEIGVSKQSVQKRISREPLKGRIQPYTKTIGNTVYIDETGERLIIEAFGGVRVSNVHDNQTATSGDIVHILQQELEAKNRQLESQSNQISELTAALVLAQQTAATAQALHVATVKQNLEDGETKQRGKGIFWRFFGKDDE